MPAPASGRKPVLVNGRLLEAQRDASHPSFVSFGSAAGAVVHLGFNRSIPRPFENHWTENDLGSVTSVKGDWLTFDRIALLVESFDFDWASWSE